MASASPLWMTTILDRYLFRELFRTVLFGVILFTVIWLAPETLFKLISYFFNGQLSFWETLTLFVYHIPGVLQQTIPMAVFVASVFLFRRLSQQMELVSFLNATVSIPRILVPIGMVGLLFVVIHFTVQEFITPAVEPQLSRLYVETGVKSNEDTNFVYVEKDPNTPGRLDKFFLIGRVLPNKLTDFIILYYDQSTPNSKRGSQIIRILRAPEGRWDARQKAWRLFDGIDYELDKDGVYRETRRFEEQWVNTSPYAVKLLSFSNQNPKSMSLDKLGAYLALLKESGQTQDVSFYTIRFYQKLAFPLAALVFALLGACLGIEPPRSSGLLTLATSAFVLFIYGVLIPFSTNLGGLELLPPLVTALMPMVGAGLATLSVIYWRNHQYR